MLHSCSLLKDNTGYSLCIHHASLWVGVKFRACFRVSTFTKHRAEHKKHVTQNAPRRACTSREDGRTLFDATAVVLPLSDFQLPASRQYLISMLLTGHHKLTLHLFRFFSLHPFPHLSTSATWLVAHWVGQEICSSFSTHPTGFNGHFVQHNIPYHTSLSVVMGCSSSITFIWS